MISLGQFPVVAVLTFVYRVPLAFIFLTFLRSTSRHVIILCFSLFFFCCSFVIFNQFSPQMIKRRFVIWITCMRLVMSCGCIYILLPKGHFRKEGGGGGG